MLPLSVSMDIGTEAGLLIALAIGFGFGFALERAGFGTAPKLAAVFYLYDMAVLKVMVTAVVTAMIGVWLLSAAGWLDTSEIFVISTNLMAQFAGGLVFGVGFVMGGYCPGTSLAAIATGRVDGAVFALGLFAGLIAYAELIPGVDVWIRENGQGVLTLPEVTGIALGWWVLAFIAMLVGLVFGLREVERRHADLRPAT